jgi:hypothetical protein
MKVKATYRHVRDRLKDDFMVKQITWDMPDETGTEKAKMMVEEGAPPDHELVGMEMLDQ